MRNWLEWIVFSICAVIVLFVAGALIYDASQNGTSQPIVSVELGSGERAGEGYMVPVTVRNDGDASAEEVEVEVTLTSEAGGEEKSSLTFQFLPRRSHRKGWVLFMDNPAMGAELKARTVGFRHP